MSFAQVAIAVIGRAVPAWVWDLTAGLAEPHLISAQSFPTMEDALNRILARTRAPFFLVVQADDQIRPEGLTALVDTLARAAPRGLGAVAPTDQLTRSGLLRHTAATAPVSRLGLLRLSRISTPILFQTSALRRAGGWRTGEANWEHRSRRHRCLLARMLANGYLVASSEPLGVIASAAPQGTAPGSTTPADLRQVLTSLLYRLVTVIGADNLNARGRIAAVNGDLITMALADGGLLLVNVGEIGSVQAHTDEPPTVSERGAWPGRFRPRN